MPEGEVLEKPLAIVGDEDAVCGFRALGFNIYAIKEPQDTQRAFDEIVQQRIAICLIQDDIYTTAQEVINNYRGLPLPVFIPFSKSAKTDLLDNIVKDIRLRATGTY